MCRRGLLDALKFREEPPEAVFLFGIGRGNERNITCAPGFVNINVNFRLTPGGPDGIPEQPTGARRLCGIAGPVKSDHTRASRDQSQLHAIAVNEVTGDGQVRQDDAHYNDHFGLPFFLSPAPESWSLHSGLRAPIATKSSSVEFAAHAADAQCSIAKFCHPGQKN